MFPRRETPGRQRDGVEAPGNGSGETSRLRLRFLEEHHPHAAAGALLALREVLHRRWLKTGGDGRAFLLLCPTLTIVALAAKAMLDHGTDARLTAWLVLTGLFVTIPSILLLPAGSESGVASERTQGAASIPVTTAPEAATAGVGSNPNRESLLHHTPNHFKPSAARPRKKKKPATSVTVVRKMLDASAGSSFRVFKPSGIITPETTAAT